MCGCGDGIELELRKGRIEASFFREDAGGGSGLLKERADYVAGKTLLREIMMERGTFAELLAFLESAELEPVSKGGANRSHLAPTHLLDDIYAVWLQGTLPFKAAFGGEFKRMFKLSLTAMDRDVLVVQMRSWMAQEKTHAIPEGASPHVDRLAGTSAPKPKLPSKGEAKAAAGTALKSVRAAAEAAVGAFRKTSDPEGAELEEALYGEPDEADEDIAEGGDTFAEPDGDLSDGIAVDPDAIRARSGGPGGVRAGAMRSAMAADDDDDEIPELEDDDLVDDGDGDGRG